MTANSDTDTTAGSLAQLDGPRGGVTFDAERDEDRLNRQQRAVFAAMADGTWHTLDELARATGHPEASVSARLRDLRKPRHGGHTVEKTHLGHGLWAYRLVLADG